MLEAIVSLEKNYFMHAYRRDTIHQPENRSEYTTLWYRAWTIADFVDGGEAVAPYEDRIKKLPELNRMVEKMRCLEDRLKAAPTKSTLPAVWDEMIQSPAVWLREDKQTWTPDTCPARCRRTGRCYGESYFSHKAAKAMDCQGRACPWMKGMNICAN